MLRLKNLTESLENRYLLNEKFGNSPSWLSNFLSKYTRQHGSSQFGGWHKVENNHSKNYNEKDFVSKNKRSKDFDPMDALIPKDVVTNLTIDKDALLSEINAVPVQIPSRPKDLKALVEDETKSYCFNFDDGEVWCTNLNDYQKCKWDKLKRPFFRMPLKEILIHATDAVVIDLEELQSKGTLSEIQYERAVNQIGVEPVYARQQNSKRWTPKEYTYDKSGYKLSVNGQKFAKVRADLAEVMEEKDTVSKKLDGYINQLNRMKKSLATFIVNTETSEIDYTTTSRIQYCIRNMAHAFSYINDLIHEIDVAIKTNGVSKDSKIASINFLCNDKSGGYPKIEEYIKNASDNLSSISPEVSTVALASLF